MGREIVPMVTLVCDADFVNTHEWAKGLRNSRTIGELIEKYEKYANIKYPKITIDDLLQGGLEQGKVHRLFSFTGQGASYIDITHPQLGCEECDGKGYFEYETGVVHEGYAEKMQEPCDCILKR